MKHIFIALINFYRKYLSPLKGKPTCRFYPTCSLYAIRALRDWGCIRGSVMTVRRILRCQPFCAGGYDPPPSKKHAPDRLPSDCRSIRALPFFPDEKDRHTKRKDSHVRII